MRAQNVCTCLLVPWLWGWATFTLLPTSTHHRHQTWLDVSVLSHPLMCSWPLSNTSNAWRFAKAVHLHFSYEELIPWEAVKHVSRVLWPLQPVQSNPLMTMAESDELPLHFSFHFAIKTFSHARRHRTYMMKYQVHMELKVGFCDAGFFQQAPHSSPVLLPSLFVYRRGFQMADACV